MASSPTSATDPLDYFKEYGVFYLEDEAIGRIVKEVDDRGMSNNVESWESFKESVLKNEQLRRILEPFLSQPNPLRCHTFGPEPGQIFCFWPQPGQSHRLAVSMWSAGSEMEFYRSSHTGNLKAVLASNGLFEAHPTSLKQKRYKAVLMHMDKGGIAILDLRFFFERKAGFMIAYRMEDSTVDMSKHG